MGGFACMNTCILHVYTAQGSHKKALNSLGTSYSLLRAACGCWDLEPRSVFLSTKPSLQTLEKLLTAP